MKSIVIVYIGMCTMAMLTVYVKSINFNNSDKINDTGTLIAK